VGLRERERQRDRERVAREGERGAEVRERSGRCV
jgi:hypothetical protein